MVTPSLPRRSLLPRPPRVPRLGSLILALIAGSAVAQTPPPPETPKPVAEAVRGTSWPQISLSLQDAFSSENLAPVGVLNDAWCLSEYAVGGVVDHGLSADERAARWDSDLQAFIDVPISRIQQDLERYLLRFPQLSRKTTATIIIDIESPIQPRHFWKLLGGDDHDQLTPRFSEVVQAFSRRYGVVREAFPNATLTVFSMGSPDWSGQDTPQAQRRLHAEVMAARMGMLENVDAISPELYERYGPKDAQFRTADQRALQALRHAVEVIKASGRSLDLIILMTLTVFNDPNHSSLARRPADLEGLANRLDYLASMGVRRVIFWNAKDQLVDSTITVAQRFRQLRELEQSRRTSPPAADPRNGTPDRP